MSLLDAKYSPRFAVNAAFYYGEECEFEENGVEKFILELLGMLFEIKHNDVDPDLATEIHRHIQDYEEHGCKSLLDEEDALKVENNIAEVKEYLSANPQVLNSHISYSKKIFQF